MQGLGLGLWLWLGLGRLCRAGSGCPWVAALG